MAKRDSELRSLCNDYQKATELLADADGFLEQADRHLVTFNKQSTHLNAEVMRLRHRVALAERELEKAHNNLRSI